MLVKPQSNPVAKIKVVGVGGGGGNVINTMVDDKGILDVEFIAINTDAQVLQVSKADTKLRIGDEITRGLGSGGNPVVGKKAAEESIESIHEALAGADMVFVTAGMGGGTGTGAAPIVGEVAKNLGALTIAVVMKPFHFEGQKRMATALKGIEELKEKVDTMIIVPNQRLLEIMDPGTTFQDAMVRSDQVLLQAVKSIANLSTKTGIINVDFADVRSVMDNAGTAMMGIGRKSGEDRAVEAAIEAIESPLLEVKIDGATGVLFNIIAGTSLGVHEIDAAANTIRERTSPDVNFIFGAQMDESMGDELEVTVVATGFSDEDEYALTSVNPFQSQAAKLMSKQTQPKKEIPDKISAPKSTKNEAGFEIDPEIEDQPSYLRRKGNIFED